MKFSSVIKHISHSVGILTKKTLHEKSLSGGLFGPNVWLDLISSKTTMEWLSPWIQSVMLTWKPAYFSCYWKIQLAICYKTVTNMALLQKTISRPRGFLTWRYQLPTRFMRFDTIQLFCWCVSLIMPTFNFIRKTKYHEKRYLMCLIYICFWNRKMDKALYYF